MISVDYVLIQIPNLNYTKANLLLLKLGEKSSKKAQINADRKYTESVANLLSLIASNMANKKLKSKELRIENKENVH